MQWCIESGWCFRIIWITFLTIQQASEIMKKISTLNLSGGHLSILFEYSPLSSWWYLQVLWMTSMLRMEIYCDFKRSLVLLRWFCSPLTFALDCVCPHYPCDQSFWTGDFKITFQGTFFSRCTLILFIFPLVFRSRMKLKSRTWHRYHLLFFNLFKFLFTCLWFLGE